MAKMKCSRCDQEHTPISAQRRRFAELYATHFDTSRAIAEAGYSRPNARKTGYILLQRLDVKCELRWILSKTTADLELKASDVLGGLLRIAQFDPADIFNDDGTLRPLSQVPKHIRQAIAGLKFKDGRLEELKLPDKVRAHELLGKNQRLFTDVFRHEGDIDIRARIARGRRRAQGKDE